MRLEMKNIVMEFGPVRAVDNVSITVNQGEIVGLLGENGAGKSTLMNVLAGIYTPVSGQILIDGKEVAMKNVRTADQNGIRFIHQELNLCKDLRVWENMFLGNELQKKTGFVDKQRMVARCKEVFGRMHADIDPDVPLEMLSAAEKQLVEIGRALLFESQLIIMDEPSTALDPRNRRALIGALRARPEGKLIASHDLDLILETCRRVLLISGGRLAADGPAQTILRDRTLLEENGLELPFCLAGVPDV